MNLFKELNISNIEILFALQSKLAEGLIGWLGNSLELIPLGCKTLKLLVNFMNHDTVNSVINSIFIKTTINSY